MLRCAEDSALVYHIFSTMDWGEPVESPKGASPKNVFNLVPTGMTAGKMLQG